MTPLALSISFIIFLGTCTIQNSSDLTIFVAVAALASGTPLHGTVLVPGE